MKSEKKNGTYFLSVLMTILGFLLAAFLNAAVPQKADVVFKPHEIFGITTDSNTAYRFVLRLFSQRSSRASGSRATYTSIRMILRKSQIIR